MTELPSYTRRLFDGYAEADLTLPEHRPFLCERLLEEGDHADLHWLTSQVPEDELRDQVRRFGGRRLSARSRAFWRLLLLPAGAAGEAGEPSFRSELWPLA